MIIFFILCHCIIYHYYHHHYYVFWLYFVFLTAIASCVYLYRAILGSTNKKYGGRSDLIVMAGFFKRFKTGNQEPPIADKKIKDEEKKDKSSMVNGQDFVC